MTRVRLLTANLLHDHADPALLAALLRALRVDVACFQELGPRQAEAIGEVLPHGLLDPGWGARRYHGAGLVARFPIEVRRLGLPHRDALGAGLTPGAWPGLTLPVEVNSVHLLAPTTRPVHVTLRRRREQLAGYLRHLDGGANGDRLVAAGDLNAAATWPAYRALRRRLHDLVAAHASREGRRPAPTWGPRPLGPRVLRIDHVLGRGVQVANAGVVRVWGSDHSAIVVDLEV